jgi:hypothetical protein
MIGLPIVFAAAAAAAAGAAGFVVCSFPLELPTYTPQGLIRHQEQAHKHCQFCDLWFFAVDELWGHMRQQHFHCAICQSTGNPDLYFK